MSKHRHTTALCMAAMAVMLTLTLLFMFGQSLGITVARATPPYAPSLFSTDKIHTLDIVVDQAQWEEMLTNAQAEAYILANVVVDGNSVKNVGIRPKGNSSLSSIASSDSDRYSFKIEFDHYNGAQTYQGLDKLALNNIAQDYTYLKDYISYRMMAEFGVDAPLCSFIYITVNGEDWGLYLAVEAVEESFAERNYGSDYGQLYKPDNMDMNMGRMDDFIAADFPAMENLEDFANLFEGGFPGFGGELPEGFGEGGFQFPQDGTMPNFFVPAQTADESAAAEKGAAPTRRGFDDMRVAFGGRGSSDVALIYTDDEYTSYSSIFDNAKFSPSDADKDRLIASIKQLNEGVNLEEVVDIEQVLRYFVVHNFVLNFDSYTGSLLHNYYLHEQDGVLSMIPWDYNLAFGAMSMGGIFGMGNSGSATDAATSAVNFPIDTPVSGANMEDRPLLNQLLSNEAYLAQYHALFQEFIREYFDSGAFTAMYENAVGLISPYVAKDPTAFCTYGEFNQAQEALKEFCLLRAQSVQGQLDGTIASTSTGQTDTQSAGFVQSAHIDMSAMGSNMMGFSRARNRSAQQVTDPSQQLEQSNPNSAVPPEGARQGNPAAATQGGAAPSGVAPNAMPFGGSNQGQNDLAAFDTLSRGAQPEAAPDLTQAYWMLGVTLLLMACGLVFAARYKTRAVLK